MFGGSIKKNQWWVFLYVISSNCLGRLNAITSRLQRDNGSNTTEVFLLIYANIGGECHFLSSVSLSQKGEAMALVPQLSPIRKNKG